MGEIKRRSDDVYRDYVVPNVPASGEYDPPKRDIRAQQAVIDGALTTLTTALAIGVAYPLQATLNADLAHAPGKIGAVYNDGAASGFYVKVGASGTGSWAATGIGVPASFAADLADAQSDISDLGATKVAKSTTIGGSGLATGGGDLSASRTITVAKASEAEAVAGTEDAKAVTPKGLKAATDALDIPSRAAKATTIGGGGLATGGGDLSEPRIITVPKATTAEAIAGVRDDVAATPASVKAALDQKILDYATEDNAGLAAEADLRAAAVTALDNAKAAKITTITAGGLATGGGDLSAGRTITVPKASDAEVVTGTEDAKAVTPKGVKAATDALDVPSRAAKATTITAAGLATGGGDLSAGRTITVAKASEAEAVAGTEDAKAVTPKGLKAATDLKSGRYVEGLTGGLKGQRRAIFTRRRKDINGFYFSSGSFQWWAVGVVPSRTLPAFGGLEVYPADVTAVATLLVQVWRRPVALADNNVAPGTDASDVLLNFGTYPIATWRDPTVALTGAHKATLDLSSLNLGSPDPAYCYWFKIFGLNGSNAIVNMGYASGADAANTSPAYARGWFSNGTTSVPLSGVETLAFALFELIGMDGASPERRHPRPQTVARAEMQAFWPTSAGGANTADTVIVHAAGQSAIPGQLATFTAPATTAVTDEIVSLQYANEINLAHQNVASVVVRRQSNNALLAENTDYEIDYDQASIKGLVNTASFNVKVSYSGKKSRVDVIYADPDTMALGIAAGTDRGTDAIEYIPATPAGKVAIARAYVTVSDGVDILDLRRFQGFMPVGGEGAFLAWIETSRRRLPKIMQAMAAGRDIAFFVYGDSTGEIGATPPGDYLLANGTGRDTLQYIYAGRYPSDTVAAIPLHDQGDTGGAIHAAIGPHFVMKAAIEANSASRVFIRNRSIGGTRTSNDSPGGVPNLNATARRDALFADIDAQIAMGRHVVVYIPAGTNEMGLSITRGNLVSLATDIKARGADVLLTGLPIFSRDGSTHTLADWRETNRQIEQASEDTKSALIPTWMIADPEATIAALGIPWRAAGAADGNHHPGLYEMRRYGEFASLIFGGAPAVLPTIPNSAPALLANAIPARLTLGRRIITGTTGTITAADTGLVIETTNGSAVTITLPNDQVEGFNCQFRQAGAGQVTFTAASGATLRNADAKSKTRTQWSEVSLHVRGNSTGAVADWVLNGDTE